MSGIGAVYDSGTEQLLFLRLRNCRRKKFLSSFEHCSHFNNRAQSFEGGECSKTMLWFALTAQIKVPVSFLAQICWDGFHHLGAVHAVFCNQDI